MDVDQILTALSPLKLPDLAALTFVALCWFALERIIENTGSRRLSVSVLMISYRREWMRHSVTRDPRVYDAMIVASLREGTAFFASACMLAIGGLIALIGNVEQLTGFARDLAIERAPEVIWELKLVLVLLFVTSAFLQFVWAHRVFGYCSVMMAAVSNDESDPIAHHRADQAADLNVSAAKAFNRGLRSVYFALGALPWLLGAAPLALAIVATAAVLLRREFASATRATLLRNLPEETPP